MGRPSKYTPELVESICERLATGEPLAVICRDEGMPDPATVWRWSETDEAISQDIARAREVGFDAIAARTRETARGSGDSAGDVQRDKLIIDTDLKLLSKWSKRYSDRMTLAGDKEAPLNVLPDDQIDARLNDLLRKAELDANPAPQDDERG